MSDKRPNRLVRVSALVAVLVMAGSALGQNLPVPVIDHPAAACSFPFHVQGAGWDLCWQQDDLRGQGLELNQAYFQGESVIWKIGFPFSITKYEGDRFGPYKDTLGESLLFGENPGFGRGSMTIGRFDCPRFFGDGILLNDNRVCVEHRGGPEPAIAVWARYDIFNYRFLQGYFLDSRGVIEPFVRLGGTLADGDFGGSSGTNHFHHIYWRVDFETGQAGNDGFQAYLRPDPAWNDWEPYTVWTPEGDIDEEDPTLDCSRFASGRGPPVCQGQDVDGNFTLVDPLAAAKLPLHCRQQVEDGITGWCSVEEEAALRQHANLFTKWRVHDHEDTNDWGRHKSFESTGRTSFDVPADGDFATFDVMVLQGRGGSQEVGFEVPARPTAGDSYLESYMDPPETVMDPVVWFATHAYHDTRDEEWPTMSFHHVSFSISPRDFMSENPGENSYAGGNSPLLHLPVEPGGPPGGGITIPP